MRRRIADNLCKCLARNMPRRLMYFTVLEAASVTSFDDDFSHIPKDHIRVMDVVEYVKPIDA